MERLGADGYRLLHNHPSGNPKPSMPDVLVTKRFAEMLPGFKGHVVINSGTFGTIMMIGDNAEVSVRVLKSHDRRRVIPKDKLLSRLHEYAEILSNETDLARLGQQYKSPRGFVTVMYRDADARLRAVQDMPLGLFKNSKEAANYIRGFQRKIGAQEAFAVIPDTVREVADQDTIGSAQKLIKDGFLTDAIRLSNGGGSFRDQMRYAGVVPSNIPSFAERNDLRTVRVQEEGQPYSSSAWDRLDQESRDKVLAYGKDLIDAGKTDFASWSKSFKEDLGPEAEGAAPGAWAALMQEMARTQSKKAPTEVPVSAPAVEGPPALTSPQLKLGFHQQVLDVAEELFKAGKLPGLNLDPTAADPRLLSDRILDGIRDGKIRVEDMADTLDRHGMTFAEFGSSMFRPAITDAAKRLGALGLLKRRIMELEEDLRPPGPRGGKPPLPEGERLKKIRTLGDLLDAAESVDPSSARQLGWWRRADNIRRGLLVTQLATSVRNFTSQIGRLGIDVLDQGLQGGLQRIFGFEQTAHAADSMAALMDSLSPSRAAETKRKVDALLEGLPREQDRLFNNYASDITRAAKNQGVTGKIDSAFQGAERAVELLNTVNRFQEYIVRRAVFQAELDARLRRRGTSIEEAIKNPDVKKAIPVADIRAAIQRALEITFSATPAYGSAGYHVLKAINKMPFTGTAVIPFPRFMMNSLKFLYEFSPVGAMKLLTEAERQKVRQGDMKTISRATVGMGLLATAFLIRGMQDDDTKWNEIRLPGMERTIDVRPYNPFAAYLFVADLMTRAAKGTLYGKHVGTDIIRNVLGVNVRGGTGLQILDTLVDGIREVGSAEKLTEWLQRAGGKMIAGLLTPLQNLTDLYEQFDPESAVVRNVRERPITGPIMERLPGPVTRALGYEEPEERYVPTAEGPMKRDQPGLRQLTGLTTQRPKNDFEKELDRLQMDYRDLLPPQGDPRLENAMARFMGEEEEKSNRFVNSARFQSLGDMGRRLELQGYLRGLRARARAKLNTSKEYRDIRNEVKAGTPKERLREMAREERMGLR
jgi:hypothetical protein